MTRVLLLLAVCLASLSASAHGASLYGKVVEVSDGDTITIVNLNKPVIVRLIGVAAPNQQQRFADVAKQHLSDLILYHSVSVEYSGFVQNNYLLGTVLYKEMDIGAQMIRDGVAWFDPETATRLSESTRQVYAECERAARAEHRGLWQDPEPVAPWNFKQQAAQAAARQANSEPSANAKPKVLSTEDLFTGIAGSSRGPRTASNSSIAVEDEWQLFAPAKQRFSVMVPGVGHETSLELPAGTSVVKANYWVAEHQGASYLLVWARGPNTAYTDSAAIEDVARGMLTGLNRSLARGSLETPKGKPMKVGSVSGIEYDLSGSGMPGVMRIFSRKVGDEREIYVLGVLNASQKSPSASRFLSSLSFGSKK